MNTASAIGVTSAGTLKSNELTSNLKVVSAGRDLKDTTNEERAIEVKENEHQASSEESSPEESEEAEQDTEEGPIFDPYQCLFCNHISPDLDTNLTHMSKTHSTIIPDEGHLLVDFETLLQYLHLVINFYMECIYCGSQRRNARAVQQHMSAQRHCRFDITDAESEYRDFYDFGLEGKRGEVVDETTMRLPDGRLLSHRSAHTIKRNTSSNLQQDRLPASSASASTDDDASVSVSAPSEAKQLTRAELRGQVLATQIATMRQSDQRSLAHLPVPEQRTLLATQKRQVEMARKEERKMQGRVQGKGNKGLMKFFKPDVPGRLNG